MFNFLKNKQISSQVKNTLNEIDLLKEDDEQINNFKYDFYILNDTIVCIGDHFTDAIKIRDIDRIFLQKIEIGGSDYDIGGRYKFVCEYDNYAISTSFYKKENADKYLRMFLELINQ